jgi:predicted P-loop ATPase
MKNLVLILAIIIPSAFSAQSSRDINIVIQKTLDLHALSKHFSESETSGETPIIIINDDKIPDNLIVFKFNKRVKIMTPAEIETFKTIYKGSLDSYFVFEVLEFTDDKVTIKATFRNADKIAINVSMKKEDKEWLVTESSAG